VILDTPQIIETGIQQTAVIHLTVPRGEIRNVMGPGLEELRSRIPIRPTGVRSSTGRSSN
jgi:hypothetical protein